MSCAVCNRAVNRNTDLKVYCAICKLVSHATCVNLTESDVEFLSENSSAFLCVKCANDKKIADRQTGINSSFAESQSSTPKIATKDKGSNKISNLNSNNITIDQIYNMLIELKTMLTKSDENVKNLSTDLTTRVTNLEELVSKITSISNENNDLKIKLDNMQIKMDKLECVLNKKCLEFRGLPNNDTVKNSPVESVKKLLDLGLGINNINEKEIIKDCWYNKKKNIIARFSDYSFVNTILKQKKLYRNNLNTKAIFDTAKSTNIYINELMSTNQKMLLYEAKELNKIKKLNYQFVWFSYGSVKMRTHENAKDHIKIECLNDLKKLLNE